MSDNETPLPPPPPDEEPQEAPQAEGERPQDNPLPGGIGSGKLRRGPTTTAFTLRDLLIVTYALPVERVRPHVPDSLPLDMLPDAEGERLAFVQTLCAFHADARWALLPQGTGQSFHQITHRVLVRRGGRKGAFLLRTSLGSDEARAAQRVISRDAEFARFNVYIAGNPAVGTYTRYQVRAAGDTGPTRIDAQLGDASTVAPPIPFAKWEEAAAFLADRPDNYFRASIPRSGVGLAPWRYGELPAVIPGTLTSARIALWADAPLALLSEEELAHPFCVVALPSIAVSSAPARYARFK